MKKKKAKAPAAKREGTGPGDRDLAMLKELLALLDGSTAASIRLQRGETTYEVARAGGGSAAHHVVQQVAGGPAGMAAAPAAAPAAPVPPPSNLIEIKSPMVGTYYRAPEPGAEPYVKVGSRVSGGQTLCIIEAMKIMNEIESEVAGTVREILVDDAQPVEFGQVLFRVEPHV